MSRVDKPASGLYNLLAVIQAQRQMFAEWGKVPPAVKVSKRCRCGSVFVAMSGAALRQALAEHDMYAHDGHR